MEIVNKLSKLANSKDVKKEPDIISIDGKTN